MLKGQKGKVDEKGQRVPCCLLVVTGLAHGTKWYCQGKETMVA